MIHNKIKLHREQLVMSQQEMADRLFISPLSYMKIENGTINVNYERILELSSIFGIEPMSLINSKIQSTA